MTWRQIALLLPALLLTVAGMSTVADPATVPNDVLHGADFDDPALPQWTAELEGGRGTVAAREGKLVIDVPAGCTVWFKPKLHGPLVIEYEATVVAAGGANDRVSDLNCFFMATDARSPGDLFATPRSGKFEEYNPLKCYYVGVGGNGNTTTRFRRYVGDKELRPLLPEHDLRDEKSLLVPNRPQVIRIVCDGPRIEFWRDGTRMFEMHDAEPYTSGHFAFRTVSNHMEIRHFRVYRLPTAATTTPTTKPEATHQ